MKLKGDLQIKQKDLLDPSLKKIKGGSQKTTVNDIQELGNHLNHIIQSKTPALIAKEHNITPAS